MTLACVPWDVRNYVVFHEVFFIGSNLGLERRMGNFDGAIAESGSLPRHLDETRVDVLPLAERGNADMFRELFDFASSREQALAHRETSADRM